jgi:hypothetical protein
LRSQSNERASPIGQELGNPLYPISNSESEDTLPSQNLNGSLTKETLLAAFLAISRRWMEEAQDAQRQITTLASFSLLPLTLRLQNLRPVSDSALYQSTGLTFVPTSTLQEWKNHIKNITGLTNQTPDTEPSSTAMPDLNDFNIDLTDNVLLPILTNLDEFPDLPHLRLRIGQNPTGASITSLVRELIPLNQK